MKRKEKPYNEIRLDKQGNFDDIVIYGLHLERMDNNCWWLGYYKGKDRIGFLIESKRKINVTLHQYGLKTEIIRLERNNL